MKSVIVYDADCGFCRWLLAKIIRRDPTGAFRPVDLRTAEAIVLLPKMNEATRMSSWHLVETDGRVYSGGAAIAPLLEHLPGKGLRFGARLARTFPSTVEGLYRFLAANRHRFGRWLGEQACSVDPAAMSVAPRND